MCLGNETAAAAILFVAFSEAKDPEIDPRAGLGWAGLGGLTITIAIPFRATLPFDHGCFVIHSTVSYPSVAEVFGKSKSPRPGEVQPTAAE